MRRVSEYSECHKEVCGVSLSFDISFLTQLSDFGFHVEEFRKSSIED